MVYGLILTPFLIFSLVQFWLARKMTQAFREPTPPPLPDSELPHALVVLSLKGGDPKLIQCLERLTTLDYPNYVLRLVIDSPQDPALEIVNEFLRQQPQAPVETIFMGERRKTCSGKISGMLRGTEDLDGFEVVAFVDGDAMIEPFWLRKLVEGLQDQHIGLVTGNRWYVPSSPKLGTLSCYFWNIFAIPMMNAVEIPWGGSIALRAEDMRPGTLRDHLANAFGEDSTLATYFRSHNQHVRFLPDLIVLNHDDCGLMQLYNFVVRQYLTVRMNNPRWPRVVLYNMFLGLLMTICLPVAWMFPEFASPIYVGYPILTCSLIMLAIHTQNLVRERVRTISNKSIFWVTPARFAMFLVAIPVMAILNIMATIQSFFTREHVWRGLRYRFGQNPRVLIISEYSELPRLGSVVAPLAEATE